MLEKFKKMPKLAQIIISIVSMIIAIGSTIVCLVIKKDHAEDKLWLVCILAAVAILFWVVGPSLAIDTFVRKHDQSDDIVNKESE